MPKEMYGEASNEERYKTNQVEMPHAYYRVQLASATKSFTKQITLLDYTSTIS